MDKQCIVDLFNEHSPGYLFDRTYPGSASGVSARPPTGDPEEGISDSGFTFECISITKVLTALKAIDPKKPSGPDSLDPYLLKLSAEIIAAPLAHIFLHFSL